MAENLLPPYAATLVASTTYTATTSSALLTLPLADSYSFILDTTAASGTSPTMDVAIQINPDGAGTTMYSVLRFAQVTGTNQQRITVQPIQGRGEAGTQAALADTGGAASANQPLTSKIKVKFTLGGTSPSFTAIVWVVAQIRATAV